MSRDKKGSANGRAKLDEKMVKEILTRWKNESAGNLAHYYGVCKSTIKSIRQGKSWAHVPRPESKSEAAP